MSSKLAEQGPCAHCGAPTLRSGSQDPDAPLYCCAGCEIVAGLIADRGLERFYADRDGFSPRPTIVSTEAFDNESYQKAWVRELPDGTLEGRFRVSGVRCSACVWLNEKVLQDEEGVEEAHVSYGTSMATVRWNPATTQLSTLTAAVARLGYTPIEPNLSPRPHRGDLVKLGVAAFCASNVMMMHIALYLGDFFGMELRHIALFSWASLIVATPAVFYSSTPFFQGSWSSLRLGMVSMDVPVAIAIVVMYVHGVWALQTGHEAYLDSLTMLIAFLLVGRVLVQHGRDRAAQAAESVLEAAPRMASRREGDEVREVPVAELVAGDILVAGAGQRVAADSTILSGSAWIDLAHVTGEARPVASTAGEVVPAGAAIVSGQLELRVEREASASTVARIGEMVRSALDARTPVRALADRIAPWFTLGVIVVAALTWLYWYPHAGLERAIAVLVAVLVVACPCALALAAPTTLAVGIGSAARRGAFVRTADALLRLATINRAAFDKTGTLTEGSPRVTQADDDILALAAALEIGDQHPVAKAIVRELERRKLPIPRASDVSHVDGGGIQGIVDGRTLAVLPQGPGVARVESAGEPLGLIHFEDCVRSDASQTLARLGVPATILSGDHPEVVARIAGEVGLSDAHGGMRPEAKAEWVREHEVQERVLFAGDGINDAPALAQATVGIAMGEGAEAAVRTADVVILESSLSPVEAALTTGRVIQRTLRRNARFAVTYNVTAVILAASGLITPLWAAILMPCSSAVVIINALSVEWQVRRSLDRSKPAAKLALQTAPATRS